MPSLTEMIFGSSEPKISSGMTSSQQKMFNDMMGMLQKMQQQYTPAQQAGVDYLQELFSPEAYSRLEAPAMRQFQEEIVPGIAERFSAMGSGSKGSSAMKNSLGRAGVDLATNLASIRQQGMMGALPQALGLQQFPMQAQMGLFGQGVGANIGGLPYQGIMPGIGLGLGQAFGQGLTSGFGSLYKTFFG